MAGSRLPHPVVLTPPARSARQRVKCHDMRVVCVLMLVLWGVIASGQSPQRPSFEDLLRTMSSAGGDVCESAADRDLSNVELNLFNRADEAVARGLNSSSAGSPVERATVALKRLEGLSTQINKAWSSDDRFHFYVLDISPAIVVRMGYRNRATFSVFAVSELDQDGKKTGAWRRFESFDGNRLRDPGAKEWLGLSPLYRGPAQQPRFLAKRVLASCGSGLDFSYYGYEWNPKGLGDLVELIGIDGSDSEEDPFEGKLQTSGSVISLPYCWFSPIDTWHNPTLCAVDSYDLSGDRVRFVSRVYNRPDLIPVAKAMEYAKARDYSGTVAYCASPEVARKMVSELPPDARGTELTVKEAGPGQERVQLGSNPTYQFEVEQRGDRWLVVAFRIE